MIIGRSAAVSNERIIQRKALYKGCKHMYASSRSHRSGTHFTAAVASALFACNISTTYAPHGIMMRSHYSSRNSDLTVSNLQYASRRRTYTDAADEQTHEVQRETDCTRNILRDQTGRKNGKGQESAKEGCSEAVFRVPISSNSFVLDDNFVRYPAREWCAN